MKTVLITGANAGLGFASARQLAKGSWDHVVISARSQAKADDAISRLEAATGRSIFDAMIFDNNRPETIRSALDALEDTDLVFDAVILNAGGMPRPSDDGLPGRLDATGWTEMYAMNVGGHVQLVDGLQEAGRLTPGATIMFSSSEAARGIPSMRVDTPKLPTGSDALDAKLEGVVTGTSAGSDYDPMLDYGMVKLIGSVWMRQLRDRHGLRALAVSPGFTGGTDAMKKLPFLQRVMFEFVALPIMRLTGNAHGLETGAARYVQALEDQALVSGEFYASRGTKVSGPLAPQDPKIQPLLADAAFEEAVHRLIDRQISQNRTPAIAALAG